MALLISNFFCECNQDIQNNVGLKDCPEEINDSECFQMNFDKRASDGIIQLSTPDGKKTKSNDFKNKFELSI